MTERKQPISNRPMRWQFSLGRGLLGIGGVALILAFYRQVDTEGAIASAFVCCGLVAITVVISARLRERYLLIVACTYWPFVCVGHWKSVLPILPSLAPGFLLDHHHWSHQCEALAVITMVLLAGATAIATRNKSLFVVAVIVVSVVSMLGAMMDAAISQIG